MCVFNTRLHGLVHHALECPRSKAKHVPAPSKPISSGLQQRDEVADVLRLQWNSGTFAHTPKKYLSTVHETTCASNFNQPPESNMKGNHLSTT